MTTKLEREIRKLEKAVDEQREWIASYTFHQSRRPLAELIAA